MVLSISPPPSPHLFYPPINIYKPHCNHNGWWVVGVGGMRRGMYRCTARLCYPPQATHLRVYLQEDIWKHRPIEPGRNNQVFPQGHWLINLQSLWDVCVCRCVCVCVCVRVGVFVCIARAPSVRLSIMHFCVTLMCFLFASSTVP